MTDTRALVYVEERDGEAVAGSLGLIAKARELGLEASALVCGAAARELAWGLGAFGAQQVYIADDASLAGPLAQPRVSIVADIVARDSFDVVLFENSALTADIAAGVSSRLDAGVNWDLVDLELSDGELVGTRLALGDTVIAKVAWHGPHRIAVMRRGILEPVETGGDAAVKEVQPGTAPPGARIVARLDEDAEQATIERAEIIVAGGRGLGTQESLGALEELADALGGAVAVTMPLVDRGWYPYAHQVGQTGRTVKPRLYIACGISGAIQHRVGMEKSGTIVAINSDATAPIFGFCDVGVVGDLHEIVPELTALVRARQD